MSQQSLKSTRAVDNLVLRIIGDPDLSGSAIQIQEDIIDWDLFLKRVFEEGVGGLVYYKLKDHSEGVFPLEVVEALEKYYLTNLGRNLCIEEELKILAGKFQERRVDILLIRGADFLRWLYPSLGIRPMSDVDAIVRSRDFTSVRKCLGELGYKHPPEYPYLWYKDEVSIDLHLDVVGFWRVASWPSTISIENKEIWQRSQSYQAEGDHARCLGVYESILGCCSHLQMHSFKRLIWFVDIATIINNREDFDWQRLLEAAKRFNLLKPLYFVVKYLDKVGFIFLPKEAAEELDTVQFNWFERRNLSLLLENKRDNLCGESMFLFSVPGFLNKIKFIADIIFIQEDKFVLSKKASFWSYSWRFLRISFYVMAKALAVLWVGRR